MDEQDKRIQKVLAGVDKKDEIKAFRAWDEYLDKNLEFPFDATVVGDYDRGPLQFGDKISVKRFSIVDDSYGIIVELRRGRKKFDHPLCDLEVINRDSANYQHVRDYSVWFANRW